MAQDEHTKTQPGPVLVLFRDDLRIHDNRALAAAADTGEPVIPVYIRNKEPARRDLGAARLWWLHHSLSELAGALEKLGVKLVLRAGPTAKTLHTLIDSTGATTVFWNRRYDPACIDLDSSLKLELRHKGLHVESFDGHLLHEPSLTKTGSGTSYKVFTPFWRSLSSHIEPRDPVDAPKALRPYLRRLASDDLKDWNLLPTAPDWTGCMREAWTPGETAARERLDDFLDDAIKGYAQRRDLPSVDGTSRLSPYLAFGEITPFQIFRSLRSKTIDAPTSDVETFRKEVGWREFSYHLLFHNPGLAAQNFNPSFDAFAWENDDKLLKAWQKGQTGYPIVDAGMRQLWQSGWMHNRVRMITASFLIKHLLVDWRKGEAWFWDTLVDADPANNAASWQWVAGSGADASPYFRIFNPILQGEKFDPKGDYIRRFVPELSELPDKYIHCPWDASKDVLDAAGVKLGANYPVPVVDHKKARDRALQLYKRLKGPS
ncbi:deoxyribodipyrimidine photo-lyase [Corticibacterium sp. UT-5YL-CI-8]|nr:deoxyribodipyrimidine photo-lyase [Tianweitania sp. UT-5YL-CI-8]